MKKVHQVRPERHFNFKRLYLYDCKIQACNLHRQVAVASELITTGLGSADRELLIRAYAVGVAGDVHARALYTT